MAPAKLLPVLLCATFMTLGSWGLLSAHPARQTRRAQAASAGLIIPGERAGPVRLGESLADLRKFLQAALSPADRPYYLLRGPDTSLYSTCPNESIHETSWPPPGSRWAGFGSGQVSVHIAGGRIYFISSGVTIYRAVGGLAAGSTPEQVEKLWPNLPAYEDNSTSMALHNRPVIYWVSQAKGIAFAFASNGPRMGWTRSVDSIDVFSPHWKFQPHGCAWPGEWSPLPPGTIHLRHRKPSTAVALGARPGNTLARWRAWAKSDRRGAAAAKIEAR